MTKEKEKKKKNEDDPWRNAMNNFFGISDLNEANDATPTQDMLMEIVGVTQLSSHHGKDVDPYCTVTLSTNPERLLHKTETIQNDTDPIWTIQTGSLCIIKVPTTTKDDESKKDEGYVQVEINHSRTCLGVVAVPFSKVLKQKGERREYPIRTTTTTDDAKDDVKGILALRFRIAKLTDEEFLQNPTKQRISSPTTSPTTTTSSKQKQALTEMNFHHLTIKSGSDGNDINLQTVQNKSFTQTYKKTDWKTKKIVHRVQPFPNPNLPKDETEWLTKQDIHDLAWETSTHWVEAGNGTVATIHLEIIGCCGLPNTDSLGSAVGDMTDPFVALCLEDVMLRTDVLHDTLNPRWMPWSTRAFCIHMKHPSSFIMLGVFDYDQAPLDDHDPIGRIVIHLSKFQPNTIYTLKYQLHDDLKNQNIDRGTIWLRLRVDWDAKELMKYNKLPPPRFLINVSTPKALQVIRYICRGKTNVENATIETTKLYASEFMDYLKLYCYFLDVLMEIWLWRGRLILFDGKINIWFPYQSIVMLTCAVCTVEYPHFIPTIFFYGMAWSLLVVNFYNSNHPNPWYQCKSFIALDYTYWTGRHIHTNGITIQPQEGVDDTAILDKIDETKQKRVVQFLSDTKTAALKTYRIYKKQNVEKYAIQTQDKEWTILGDSLYSIHLVLYYLCTYLRQLRNLINWRPAGFGTHQFVLHCILLGTIWIITPISIWQWIGRILVWLFFGPHIKLLDIWYGKNYQTKQEMMKKFDKSNKKDRSLFDHVSSTFVDDILQSTTLRKMGASGRIAAEESLKLQAMRQVKFGKYTQLIPKTDLSNRFPDIPLSESYAKPYKSEEEEEVGDNESNANKNKNIQWTYVAGQKLKGNMIHEQMIQREKSSS